MKMKQHKQQDHRKNLHKFYKFVRVCISCKKQYGTDTLSPNATKYCIECSTKIRRLTIKPKIKNNPDIIPISIDTSIDTHINERRYENNGKEI